MTQFFKKIFRKTPRTRIIFFLIWDIVLISFSIWLAFFLRFEGQIPSQYFNAIAGTIVLALVFSLPIFYFLKLYFLSWRYVSTQELISLFKATILTFLFLGVSLFIFRDYQSFSGYPRSTFFISFVLIILFCGGIRFMKRIYLQIFKENNQDQKEKERILVVGAGNAGEQVLRSIQASKLSPYLPIGFIDDDITKQGVSIHGLQVLGGIDNIPKIVREYRIEEIIIVLPSAGSKAIKKAVEMGRKANLKKIKTVPSISEIINTRISFKNVREVQIEDLLDRDQVFLDTKSIENFIRNKKILITGAAGSIGSELCRQIAKFNPSLLLMLDQDETGIFNISEELKDRFPKLKISAEIANIQDENRINRIFSKFRPNIVFHAAAYKHVPLMEIHYDEAIKNNIFGTKIVAEAALKHGVKKFIFISTDKAINPTSIMGATKRVGEMISQVLNQENSTRFSSVRFGNVLGSRGSVIPIFKEQIKKGGPVEITHPEMKRYFMTTPEACLLVMQAAEIGRGGEVFVLDMGQPIKILDLAKEMIRISGFEPDKDIPLIFSGVRPGEKFFEEILTTEEGANATKNKRIYIAKLSEVDKNRLNLGLQKLKETIQNLDKNKVILILKEIIPSYQ